MTLVSSGAISLSDIQTEFGGSNPASLSEYYRGGSYVSDHAGTYLIPTSGAIGMDDFYGASATDPNLSLDWSNVTGESTALVPSQTWTGESAITWSKTGSATVTATAGGSLTPQGHVVLDGEGVTFTVTSFAGASGTVSVYSAGILIDTFTYSLSGGGGGGA